MVNRGNLADLSFTSIISRPNDPYEFCDIFLFRNESKLCIFS